MDKKSRQKIKIGLIGGGYIGKTHAIAYRSHPTVFESHFVPELYMLAERDARMAATLSRKLGFERSTGDWYDLINDAGVDVVAIATPNAQHKDMALAAIKAGKHVYCEKPLALNAIEALEMAEAAEDAGVVNMVGYNYLVNPIVALAKSIIDGGEIGEVVHFRGRHNEDYMADPKEPFNWRCDESLSGTGALGDLGSHIISMAMFLVGDVSRVSADTEISIKKRRTTIGTMRAVENEDYAHCIVRFESGAMGSFETSRVAHGRKLGLAFEIVGSKSTIIFDQERMNELKLYKAGEDNHEGFQTILVNSSHPDFSNFCPAPGHGLGYNDLKIIEVNKLMEAIEKGVEPPVNFRQAYKIERVIDACVLSSSSGQWISI